MSHKTSSILSSTLLALIAINLSGCYGISHGPNLGIFGIPIPVSPLTQKRLEDKFWETERYGRVPILGPLTAGAPARALDMPSDDEVMRALDRARSTEGGVPFLYEKHRDDVRIVKELIADYVDPPRFYPLIGPAQLHHAHFKCTIYFSETTNVSWPIPHRLVDQDAVEVIYVDHNHLHMVGNVDPGNNTPY